MEAQKARQTIIECLDLIVPDEAVVNKEEGQRRIIKCLNSMNSKDRISIIYDLFTSDLLGKEIIGAGTNAVHFKDLEVGDRFISMPCPGDDGGHGGLMCRHFILEKIEKEENKNAKKTTGELFELNEDMHVIKLFILE